MYLQFIASAVIIDVTTQTMTVVDTQVICSDRSRRDPTNHIKLAEKEKSEWLSEGTYAKTLEKKISQPRALGDAEA